jgi:hypothetical protein
VIVSVKFYYEKLRDKIREVPSQTIVGNPGNVFDEQTDWAFGVVDILVVHENLGKDYLSWR